MLQSQIVSVDVALALFADTSEQEAAGPVVAKAVQHSESGRDRALQVSNAGKPS